MVVKTTTRKVKVLELKEKAVSKKQQRFFGMVRAAQKGEGAASPEVAKVAGEISKKDAKDFAKTKHKGLPEKVKVKEALSVKDTKKLNKASALDQSDDPKDQDRARARRTEVDYKDLLRQINSRKKPNKPAVSKMKEQNELAGKWKIDSSAHKKAQKKSKMRNLAKGNTNPNEKAAAEKKAGGPKLYGEEDNYGQAKKELKATKKARDERHNSIHKGTNTAKNTDVNEASAVLDANKELAGPPKPKRSLGKKVRRAVLLNMIKRGKTKKEIKQVMHGEEVQTEAKVDKGRSDYGKATIRNYRRKGPGHGEPAMFDPENKRGKLIDKRREEHKARRGVKKAKVPAYKVSEGVTFDAWKKAAASALRRKKDEKKPSMDKTTRKLHKWRTDKEQAEREKYVTFTKPVEDD